MTVVHFGKYFRGFVVSLKPLVDFTPALNLPRLPKFMSFSVTVDSYIDLEFLPSRVYVLHPVIWNGLLCNSSMFLYAVHKLSNISVWIQFYINQMLHSLPTCIIMFEAFYLHFHDHHLAAIPNTLAICISATQFLWQVVNEQQTYT